MSTALKGRLWELHDTVGQHFIDLLINLVAMIIVARSFNIAGFGDFSYLVALFHIVGFISEAGICDRFRNRYALATGNEDILRDAAGALFCTGALTAIFFFLTAAHSISQEVTQDRFIAYIFIAAAIPLRNGNRLRTTLLHVLGEHRDASRLLVKKNFVFLIVIWILSFLQLAPLLLGSFLIAEIYQRIIIRKSIGKIGLFQPSFFTQGFHTIGQSVKHLFSGEALNLLFHTDLFILGLFTASTQLGVYAQAALFGRFFLLIPVGLRPVLHRHFAKLTAAGNALKFSRDVFTFRAYIFYIHTLLALLLTTYFDDTIHFILGFYGSEIASYNLFTIMLPGFLFYAAIIVNESALESSGSAPFLSLVSLLTICINVLLSFYLIPFAGPIGAAFSTVICLLLYFFTLCAIKITTSSRVPFIDFISAAATSYLLYMVLGWLNLSLFIFILTVPPTLFLLLYLLSFFDFHNQKTLPEPKPEG